MPSPPCFWLGSACQICAIQPRSGSVVVLSPALKPLIARMLFLVVSDLLGEARKAVREGELRVSVATQVSARRAHDRIGLEVGNVALRHENATGHDSVLHWYGLSSR